MNRTARALHDLLKVFTTGRHHAVGNPYCSSEVRAGLKALAAEIGFEGDPLDAVTAADAARQEDDEWYGKLSQGG